VLSEVGPLLTVMRLVNQQVTYSEERIEALTTTDSRVRLLRTVPTVGPVTAAAFVAALDEVTRFRGAHEVEAYLGLVAARAEFRGAPAAWPHHQSGPQPGAPAAGAGCGVNPPAA
jgi:hypothetical protein